MQGVTDVCSVMLSLHAHYFTGIFFSLCTLITGVTQHSVTQYLKTKLLKASYAGSHRIHVIYVHTPPYSCCSALKSCICSLETGVVRHVFLPRDIWSPYQGSPSLILVC